MTTQMIIRVEPDLKNKIAQLAKSECKNLSELVRELLEKYTRERDMGAYIDTLWDKIGNSLSRSNNISQKDINKAIREVRSGNG